MRRLTALAVSGLILLTFVLPAIALAQDGGAFPYGRWEGSAIGDGPDKEGKAKSPIAVKIWLTDNGDGTVGMNISTPAVPFAFSAKPSTPQKVNGGWDIPVTVAYGSGKRGIQGTGTVQLRQRADGWYAWGSGSGSALGGATGSGHGSAQRVTAKSDAVDLILAPLKDTFGSFTESKVVAAPTEYPAPEFAAAPVETSVAGGMVQGDSSPNNGAEMVFIFVLLVLLSILGLDLGEHAF